MDETSLTGDLDLRLSVNALYMICCCFLLAMIILGISLFYSGLSQKSSSLTMLALPIFVTPLIMIDWFIWGYSLCYSSTSNNFIGSLRFVVMNHLKDDKNKLYDTPRGDILSITHFLFNGLMKVVCAALTFPSCIAERGRVLPMIVFLFLWSAMIYNPVTYWFWNKQGWLSVGLYKYGALDFAGGNCIHVVSGFTALAYSYLLGPRNPKTLYNYQYSNVGYIAVGTIFVTVGWCGFVGGCEYDFSSSFFIIIVQIILCASTSTIVWVLIDYYISSIPLEGSSEDNMVSSIVLDSNTSGPSLAQHYDLNKLLNSRRRFSLVSFTSGLLTGLVTITPAGGYISSTSELWKSFVFGAVGAVVTNFSTRLKYYFNIDDAYDVFAIHGIAGITGSLLTGIFANKLFSSEGGWTEGHWIQICYQLLGSTVTSFYVFILSCVFLIIVDHIPGLHLRIDKDFNRRLRQEKKEQLSLGSGSPQDDFDRFEKDQHIGNDFELYELIGSDLYEFNDEQPESYAKYIEMYHDEVPLPYLLKNRQRNNE